MAVQAVSPKYLAADPSSYLVYMPQSAVPGPGVSRLLYCCTEGHFALLRHRFAAQRPVQ